jgi:hypothetical protein
MVFSSSGCVNLARKEISNKGMKVLFKLKQLFTPDMPRIKTVLHVFNYTVRPVLLYGYEIKKISHLNLLKIMKTF